MLPSDWKLAATVLNVGRTNGRGFEWAALDCVRGAYTVFLVFFAVLALDAVVGELAPDSPLPV